MQGFLQIFSYFFLFQFIFINICIVFVNVISLSKGKQKRPTHHGQALYIKYNLLTVKNNLFHE